MATPLSERAILLVGHGTIRDSKDAPEFLRRIRRGRVPSTELIEEICLENEQDTRLFAD